MLASFNQSGEGRHLDCVCDMRSDMDFAASSLLQIAAHELRETVVELGQVADSLPGNLSGRSDEILARAFTSSGQNLNQESGMTQTAITKRRNTLRSVADSFDVLAATLPRNLSPLANQAISRLLRSFRI